ncbi:hypothetical protein TeGR_g13887 [Tetraparma gracilis]|uniref:Uncharacterized protein n=1 Tax=Tetraparma gracilis TaxID=2962635 RepID=A0ABQ6N8L3_9STRA|nr:hypothetical protein TeGR_g13887 [Tetraparma gracilis]
MALGSVGKGCVLVSGILTLLNGGVHIFHNVLKSWCSSSASQSCVGPALFWNSGDTPFLQDTNKLGWRTVITTDLNTVLDIWLPVVLGIFLLSTGSSSLRSQSSIVASVAYSWPAMSTTLLLVALFGAFGYNGNFGIWAGMFLSFTSALCLVTHLFALHDGKFPCWNEEGSKSGQDANVRPRLPQGHRGRRR